MNKKTKFLIWIVITVIVVSFVSTQAFAYITGYNKVLNKEFWFFFGEFKIYKIFSIFKWYLKYGKNSPHSTAYALNIAKLSLIIMIFILIGILKQKDIKIYGSARWATFMELWKKKLLSRKYRDGVILGRKKLFGIIPYIIIENFLTHIVLIAKSRSGKGTGIIVPTMLNWRGSMFVLDIKGENFQRSSAYRQKEMEQKILRISPYSTENTTHYNPLSEIRIGTIYEVRDAEIIAEILSAPKTLGRIDANSEHFITAGKTLFTGLFLYVLYKNRNASLADVYDVLTDMSETFRKKVEEIMKESFYEYEETIRNIYKDTYDLNKYEEGVHPVISATMADFLNKAEEEAGSVVSTATVKLSLFKDPIIRNNMSNSDFSMIDIMDYKKPVSVYMCVKEEELETLSPIIRIFITQLLGTSTRKIEHKYRLLMLLDEFSAFGVIPLLEKGLGYLAQYGIKVVVIAQTVNQILEVYGDKTNIIAGCATGVYYAPSQNDETTQKYISNILGSTTVKSKSSNFKEYGLSVGNITLSRAGKKLLTPEETANIGEKKAIIVTTGFYPILAEKIEFFKESYFKDKYCDFERGVNLELGEAKIDILKK